METPWSHCQHLHAAQGCAPTAALAGALLGGRVGQGLLGEGGLGLDGPAGKEDSGKWANNVDLRTSKI